jgi:hypothetical protein
MDEERHCLPKNDPAFSVDKIPQTVFVEVYYNENSEWRCRAWTYDAILTHEEAKRLHPKWFESFSPLDYEDD